LAQALPPTPRDRLHHVQVPRGRPLHQDLPGPVQSALPFQLAGQLPEFDRGRDPPDSAAGGRVGQLDVTGEMSRLFQLFSSPDEGRGRLREAQLLQQSHESGLALEPLHGGKFRHGQAGKLPQFVPVPGQQESLVVDGQQHVVALGPEQLDQALQVADGVAAERRAAVAGADVAGELRQAKPRPGVEDLQDVAGRPQRVQGLARGQARAFREQDS
jgi:hypothetical protein